MALTSANKTWVLREAASCGGLVPHEDSVAEFAESLERQGWLRRSAGPAWWITTAGRGELAQLEAVRR